MLEELLKLSKELNGLDLSQEASEIDDIIHRLYGNPTLGTSAESAHSNDEIADEQESDLPLELLEDLMIKNQYNDDFTSRISEILINTLDEDTLLSIISSIEEVVG